MQGMDNNSIKLNLKKGMDDTFGTNSLLKRRRKTKEYKDKQSFIEIIKGYEENLVRSFTMDSLCGIEMTKYDENFFKIIDSLLILKYGDEVFQIIEFYLYKRSTPGGELIPINDSLDNEYYLKTPEDLYNVIERFYPKTF